jgi:hypothetical protein
MANPHGFEATDSGSGSNNAMRVTIKDSMPVERERGGTVASGQGQAAAMEILRRGRSASRPRAMSHARPSGVTPAGQAPFVASFHLQLTHLEGPGAPELELVAPAAMEIESRFLSWLQAQNVIPAAINFVRTAHKVFVSARLLDQDGTPAIPSRAADIMVYVRRCLLRLEGDSSSEPRELPAVSA